MNVGRRRRYTQEFKTQAVSLAKTDRSTRDVAEELGIAESILYRWIREAEEASADLGAEAKPGEAEELRRLRREVADLRLENDI